ncbi:hypothetical protein BST96_01400 [Oceanicoccus sagamiensis]|uniref:Uncharacterized protein n=2 Tax=Oceanicoccus sagamiensis TaxID=716816 RepID=A0A1X9N568_9GAMM|nr:hypothetical protein BST96_01400 [Oceanicoccus sagamiensis]
MIAGLLFFHLSEAAGLSLKGWAYDFYNPQITQNKYRSLFKLDQNSPYQNIRITATYNTDMLFERCDKEPFDFIHIPENTGFELIARCHYRAVLQSIEKPTIYTLNDLGTAPLEKIKTIGVVKNSPASQFIATEMGKLDKQWQVIEFDNGGSLISALFNQKIDALVGIPGFIDSIDQKFSNKVTTAYSFNMTKRTLILIPERLSSEKSQFIIRSIIKNQNTIYINQFSPYQAEIHH